jgi:hypothetical protein
MKSNADDYLRKAAEFAEKAEIAMDAEGRRAYRNLAESYRVLSGRIFSNPNAPDSEIEALAQRMVEK